MASIYDKLNMEGVRIGTLGKQLVKVEEPKTPKLPKPKEPDIPAPPRPASVKTAEAILLEGVVDGYVKEASARGLSVDRESLRSRVRSLLFAGES